MRDRNRIRIAKSASSIKALAVCLTTGLLTESFLRSPTTSGYNKDQMVCVSFNRIIVGSEASIKVHQIRLNPISAEFERAAAFIGTIFDVDNYACLLDEGCLSPSLLELVPPPA